MPTNVEPLRSLNAQRQSFVQFHNCTERTVDIIWVNYISELVHYGQLLPTESKRMNTFVTHPWIFQDPVSGERMYANGSAVYDPEPYQPGQERRNMVSIHFPMRSLKINTVWAIAKLLASEDDVLELELPRSLSNDVAEAFKQMGDAKQFRNQRQQTNNNSPSDET